MSAGTVCQTLLFYVFACTACHQCVDRRKRVKEMKDRVVEKGYHWGEEAQKITGHWRSKSSAVVCGIRPFRSSKKSKYGSFSSGSVNEGRFSPYEEKHGGRGDSKLDPIYKEGYSIAYDHAKDCSVFLNSREGIANGSASPCDGPFIIPPVNDFHPPIVSGQWTKADTAWMTLPPPTSEKMTMLQNDAQQERLKRFGTGADGGPANPLVGNGMDYRRTCSSGGCMGWTGGRSGNGRQDSDVSPIQRPEPAMLAALNPRDKHGREMTPIARPAQSRPPSSDRDQDAPMSRPPGSRPSSSDTLKSSRTSKSSSKSTITPYSSTGSLESSPTSPTFDLKATKSKTTTTTANSSSKRSISSPISTPPFALQPAPVNRPSRKQLSPLIIPNSNPIPPHQKTKGTRSLLTPTTTTFTTITSTTKTISTPQELETSLTSAELLTAPHGFATYAKDDSVIGKTSVKMLAMESVELVVEKREVAVEMIPA